LAHFRTSPTKMMIRCKGASMRILSDWLLNRIGC
jgi:hypothetical protein